MRIGDLSLATGVPVATIKLYIREGLLPRGHVTSRTQADYSDEHVTRLGLITSLKSIQGITLNKVAEILRIIEEDSGDLVQSTGEAVAALPPYAESAVEEESTERARNLLQDLGMPYDSSYPATLQLEAALQVLEAAGLPVSRSALATYAEAARSIARSELADITNMTMSEAVEYAVLGTALYEPLLLALRRLAHHEQLTRLEA